MLLSGRSVHYTAVVTKLYSILNINSIGHLKYIMLKFYTLLYLSSGRHSKILRNYIEITLKDEFNTHRKFDSFFLADMYCSGLVTSDYNFRKILISFALPVILGEEDIQMEDREFGLIQHRLKERYDPREIWSLSIVNRSR